MTRFTELVRSGLSAREAFETCAAEDRAARKAALALVRAGDPDFTALLSAPALAEMLVQAEAEAE